MVFIGVLIIVSAIGLACYLKRDEIAQWWPGTKHNASGWPAALLSAVLGIATYVQGNAGALAVFFKNNPELVPAVGFAAGLLVLVLGWITPRKGA